MSKIQVLIPRSKITARIKTLAKEIRDDYTGETPVFIGILKGSFLFMADLVREYGNDCEMDFIGVASYAGTINSTGVIRLLKDLNLNIKKRHVLIVEDIIDTGLTSTYIKNYLRLREPKSVQFVTLLNKRHARKIDIDVKYVGFEIPNKFVIGFGLDYMEKYRQLPYVAVMED
jgi:hypoxanthine phosphoribosyltransferase